MSHMGQRMARAVMALASGCGCSRRDGREPGYRSPKKSALMSLRINSTTTPPIVSRQNRSDSSNGIRFRLPTLTARDSPAAILREIVDRETPIASATCCVMRFLTGWSLKCFKRRGRHWKFRNFRNDARVVYPRTRR